jgi:TolB protein
MADDGDGLYLVRPDGRDGHRIMTDQPARTYHPDWSPDGTRIAFERWLGNDVGEIWTANADGTDARKLLGCGGPPCLQVNSPAWSPDGTRMAVVRVDLPDPNDIKGIRLFIEVLDLSTGERRVIARTPAPGTDFLEYGGPRWSPDGKRIVFEVARKRIPAADPILASWIAVVNTDGTEVDTRHDLTDPSIFAGYPDWSPTGDLIVFNTYDQGYFEDSTEAANLYTIRPSGNALTQLTHFGKRDTRATQPTWTPDGKRVVFCNITYDPNGQFGGWGLRHIAFVGADGANTTVMNGQFATHPRLRPTP